MTAMYRTYAEIAAWTTRASGSLRRMCRSAGPTA